MGHQGFLPGSSIYLFQHWLSRFISKGWALNVVGCCLIHPPLFFLLYFDPFVPLIDNIHSTSPGWMVYVTKLHVYTNYVLLPQSCAHAHRCWLCSLPSLCSGRALTTNWVTKKVPRPFDGESILFWQVVQRQLDTYMKNN